MSFSTECNRIFWANTLEYRRLHDVNATFTNPYPPATMQALLCEKNWIDNVQWDLEDIIRNPDIDPAEALSIKRRIDAWNQRRTDIVEQIDTLFFEQFAKVTPKETASLNTESPAWAVDRLSILTLKIYHMQLQATDLTATPEHRARCQQKLDVLLTQRVDLSTALDQLLEEYANGEKVMKTYRQMKMYNDPSLNPILRGTK
ncbi:MAG: DUF4254 domain-containing protein [Bacteroides sp.]